ncbi:MAG: hypothetical protein ACM3ML_05475 [Micromonosporaceae bacterium]
MVDALAVLPLAVLPLAVLPLAVLPAAVLPLAVLPAVLPLAVLPAAAAPPAAVAPPAAADPSAGADPLARAAPPATAPPGSGRGARNVNLAITSPIAAHRAASPSSCVPISRRSKGPVFAAAAAAPAPGADWLDGLGVTAGRSPLTLPPALGSTSGNDPPARPTVLRPVVLARPDVPAPAAVEPPLAEDAAETATVITAVVRTGFFGFGLEAVASTVNLMCSPFVADVGTTSAAWSSIMEAPTSPTLHVRVPSPLPQTVKRDVADVGLVLRETVTPFDVAPDDDTEIEKYPVPPGLTLELPETTPTP